MDGLKITGPCIFTEGKVFLWNVPPIEAEGTGAKDRWKEWTEQHFELFDAVVPPPGA